MPAKLARPFEDRARMLARSTSPCFLGPPPSLQVTQVAPKARSPGTVGAPASVGAPARPPGATSRKELWRDAASARQNWRGRAGDSKRRRGQHGDGRVDASKPRGGRTHTSILRHHYFSYVTSPINCIRSATCLSHTSIASRNILFERFISRHRSLMCCVLPGGHREAEGARAWRLREPLHLRPGPAAPSLGTPSASSFTCAHRTFTPSALLVLDARAAEHACQTWFALFDSCLC